MTSDDIRPSPSWHWKIFCPYGADVSFFWGRIMSRLFRPTPDTDGTRRATGNNVNMPAASEAALECKGKKTFDRSTVPCHADNTQTPKKCPTTKSFNVWRAKKTIHQWPVYQHRTMVMAVHHGTSRVTAVHHGSARVALSALHGEAASTATVMPVTRVGTLYMIP